MPQARTPWPVAARVQVVVAYEAARREVPGLSLRRFCQATEVSSPAFARWWRAYQEHGPALAAPAPPLQEADGGRVRARPPRARREGAVDAAARPFPEPVDG